MNAQADLNLCLARTSKGTFSDVAAQLSATRSRIYKPFSCSTQLSMQFVLLINLKLLTTANSFLLNITEHENFSANKYENANCCWHFHIY